MSPAILPELFNSYVELHTAQLGALLGLFVGLLYRDRPALAYALLFLGVLSAFGNASHIGFKREFAVATEIEAKPWYFLTALYFTTVGNILFRKHALPVVRDAVADGRWVSRSGPTTGEEVVHSDDRA